MGESRNRVGTERQVKVQLPACPSWVPSPGHSWYKVLPGTWCPSLVAWGSVKRSSNFQGPVN